MKPQYVTRIINQFAFGGGDMMLANIVERERERGFKVVRPGDADWLPLALWKPNSICSVARNRVRIVLIEARHPKSGAFRRLLIDIENMEMVPVVVEPHDKLAAKLVEWGWKHRRVGADDEAENIWYPRRT